MINAENQSPHHVVVVGGGFGGLYAAKALSRDKNFNVTLIDKRNFHLFQPLLYQVFILLYINLLTIGVAIATGGLIKYLRKF